MSAFLVSDLKIRGERGDGNQTFPNETSGAFQRVLLGCAIGSLVPSSSVAMEGDTDIVLL
jgi:hypothetical protein